MDASLLLQLVISGLLIGGVYALISVGLTLIFGVMDIVNFAHGEFLMLAMFFTYWLYALYGLDPYLAVLVVAPLLFLLGVAVGRAVILPTIGGPQVAQVFATLGLSIALQNGALVVWHADFRTIRPAYANASLELASVFVSLPRLIAFVVALLIAGALYAFLRYTYPGKAIRATAQDRQVALLMGVNVRRVYLLTFGLGIACVGVAGALLMPIFAVYPGVGLPFGLVAFVAVVLGGLGSFPGAIVGGLVIGVVETVSGFYIGASLKQAVYFLVFIAILILRPAGLFGQRSGGFR